MFTSLGVLLFSGSLSSIAGNSFCNVSFWGDGFDVSTRDVLDCREDGYACMCCPQHFLRVLALRSAPYKSSRCGYLPYV